ncbi:MAG: GIY-YIG nuclease family protein [Pseudomonadota bacterium]
MENPSYVYILASAPYGTLYTGVTTDIVRRTWQHKSDFIECFTKKYGVHILVWYEIHHELMAGATREKQIKHWKRAWKVELISTSNPTWRDLYVDFAA